MKFSVPAVAIDDVQDHPGADKLSIVRIKGYQIVSQKGLFKKGDMALFIPEQSILPEWLIKEAGLEGLLSGKGKNRVKAVNLRKKMSQGILRPLTDGVVRSPEGSRPAVLGEDYREFLGIEKYVPDIPLDMGGEVEPSPFPLPKFDVENFQQDPGILAGKTFHVVEKLHGTFCLAAFSPKGEDFSISSKGLSHKGLRFKKEGTNLEKNLYVKTVMPFLDSMRDAGTRIAGEDTFFAWCGEIIGKGVQDLQYGQNGKILVLFDFLFWDHEAHDWMHLDYPKVIEEALAMGVRSAPLDSPEYHAPNEIGPMEVDRILRMAEGKTKIVEADHPREGIVLRSGNLLRKSVSETYRLRKRGTERT